MKRIVYTGFSPISDSKYKDGVSARENFIMGFIGTTRTGKTTTAIKLAKEWKKAKPDSDVVVFDPQGKFINEKVVINDIEYPLMDYEIDLYESEDWFDKVLSMRNILLILDDYRTLCPKAVSNKGWLYLMSLRAEYNIDIIYIIHAPSLIHNILTNYTTRYFIFYTLSTLGSFAKKIPHYELCQIGVQSVNKYVKNYGKGDYPNFPYVIVDTLIEKLYAYNMDIELSRKIN